MIEELYRRFFTFLHVQAKRLKREIYTHGSGFTLIFDFAII